ncbi:hypothetical protein LSUB1_G000997 [Lachnellula subtilissima]|uniref:SRR1-like domain-containing protein n=1 Tax=Lachnellula subtilissima TaxID=602034 RepID=A0A8H8RZA7_9HELO|nr:hypothetical protein LSUB1_G000997 [Lachnellula subtilissima]
MPHTNRKKKSSPTTVPGEKRKKTVVHTKRTEVLDEEGWVHVVDTPRTRRSTVSKDAKSLHAGDFEVDGVQYINRTLEEMREEFTYWKKSWETDNASAELKKALEGKGGSGVKKCVVLGLGSLQSARREGRRASFTQLAALETLLSLIGLSPGAICREKIPVVFQEPHFTDTDKQLLRELGYEVVEDPKAFGEIEENSLVYAIHCYADVYKKVSEQKRPAVFIGTDVENFGRFALSETAEVTAEALDEMVKQYEATDFPQIRHDFSDTKIYWRKNEKNEEEAKP